MLYTEQEGSQAVKATTRFLETEQVGSQKGKAGEVAGREFPISCNSEKARVKDSKKAARILKKAKKRGLELQSRNLGDSKEAVLIVCADSSYGKLDNVDSCGGRFIALVGEGGKMCPITWGSRKFPRPARSALAAEAQAAADAMGEGEAIRLQWEKISDPRIHEIAKLFEANQRKAPEQLIDTTRLNTQSREGS